MACRLVAVVTVKVASDQQQRQAGRDLGDGGREGVQVVQGEFGADHREHDRQPVVQVHQPVEQSDKQEVQRPQAEQRERVGAQHQVQVLGDAEDRRHGVQREHHIHRQDREHGQAEPGDRPAAAEPDQQRPAAARRVGGDGEPAPRPAQQPTVAHVWWCAMAAQQSHGGVDEQHAESEEQHGEVAQRGGAGQDEHDPHAEGAEDAD